jgi:hypothetical protein
MSGSRCSASCWGAAMRGSRKGRLGRTTGPPQIRMAAFPGSDPRGVGPVCDREGKWGVSQHGLGIHGANISGRPERTVLFEARLAQAPSPAIVTGSDSSGLARHCTRFSGPRGSSSSRDG